MEILYFQILVKSLPYSDKVQAMKQPLEYKAGLSLTNLKWIKVPDEAMDCWFHSQCSVLCTVLPCFDPFYVLQCSVLCTIFVYFVGHVFRLLRSTHENEYASKIQVRYNPHPPPSCDG